MSSASSDAFPAEVIKMGFPGLSNRTSNAYLVEGSRYEYHLIDCGPDTDANWARLESTLARRGAGVANVASVTVTHGHFDHSGMAARISGASGGVIRVHEADLKLMTLGRSYGGKDPERLLRGWGVPSDRLAELISVSSSRIPQGSSVDIMPLRDGEDLGIAGRTLIALATPGHTPGHMCVIDREHSIAFVGDHVLPEENPGVGLGGISERNPMVDYLRALSALDAENVRLGLPGHGPPIADLPERTEAIRTHHLRRGREVAAASNTTASVWEVAQRVRWSRGWSALGGIHLFSALHQVAQHLARNYGSADIYSAMQAFDKVSDMQST
ncbi:MBL fold metallo-hydrolase [Arthrobacter sp. AZCC_0090]|uniref:MBL fold metallo-hydrolase n=1 Tax=Arthrobacter sp. AZCC_0090 TaxID=2735881 RepID=UPI00160CB2F4|nr:MBL fold metallo-hydrolase [Arthrobacter sp. AZCC_0090]MBB6407111.1 glyoxylase-like metal-dependent hydrolase (beta-lactamase superfamily II) [Arthrobacter sp. AZCC_0090]